MVQSVLVPTKETHMTSWSGNFGTKRLVHADGLATIQIPKEPEYSVELVPAHQCVFLLCGLHHI